MEAELSLLKQLRKQTYKDLRHFVQERDKKKWRTWDHQLEKIKDLRLKSPRARKAELYELNENIDALLEDVSGWEEGNAMVNRDIPALKSICDEMIPFVTAHLGHDAWLYIEAQHALREKQAERQAEYDPTLPQLEDTKIVYPKGTAQYEREKDELQRLSEAMMDAKFTAKQRPPQPFSWGGALKDVTDAAEADNEVDDLDLQGA